MYHFNTGNNLLVSIYFKKCAFLTYLKSKFIFGWKFPVHKKSILFSQVRSIFLRKKLAALDMNNRLLHSHCSTPVM